MTDDAELLRSFARDRTEAALAEVVRRHVDLVYSGVPLETGARKPTSLEIRPFGNYSLPGAELCPSNVLASTVSRFACLNHWEVALHIGNQ
jgi:hypothetical protein